MISRHNNYCRSILVKNARIINQCLKSSLRFCSNASLYNVHQNPANNRKIKSVVGEVVDIDMSIDLKSLSPGDVINVPFELTLSSSFRDFWQSTFFSNDRISTSTPFARELGLQDQIIPISFLLFLAGSVGGLPVEDKAKTQVGFKHARYRLFYLASS